LSLVALSVDVADVSSVEVADVSFVVELDEPVEESSVLVSLLDIVEIASLFDVVDVVEMTTGVVLVEFKGAAV